LLAELELFAFEDRESARRAAASHFEQFKQ
jgi:hypothetical protein